MKLNGREMGDIDIKIGYRKIKNFDRRKSKGKGLSSFDYSNNTIYLNCPKSKRWKLNYKGYLNVLLEHEYLHGIIKFLEGEKAGRQFDKIVIFNFNRKTMTCSHLIVTHLPLYEPEKR